MIRRITGTISEVIKDEIVLDVNGVGFQIAVPTNHALHLNIGDELTLYTHLSFTNEQFTLQGFETSDMLGMFAMLLTVNGVGVKAGMSILGSLTVPEIVQCIQTQHPASLVGAPGIGKKTAERIVLELNDKVKDIEITVADAIHSDSVSANAKDATDALVALGYSRRDAQNAVETSWDEGIELQELIRTALQQMRSVQ